LHVGSDTRMLISLVNVGVEARNQVDLISSSILSDHSAQRLAQGEKYIRNTINFRSVMVMHLNS
jgi:hypothetical protein